jgi:hypothetical protein
VIHAIEGLAYIVSASTLLHVVLPTLAMGATWLVVGLVLGGIGIPLRRALDPAAEGSSRAGVCSADLWIGLAALVAYLQIWNLFFALSWKAWVAPVGIALAGLVRAPWRFAARARQRRSLVVGALVGLGTLWLANQALGVADDYDLGLYHLNVIEYAERYPTIPGLGNLATRLGAGDAHLLFVAFLDHGPWAGAGWHVANGLLVTMLFVELASRLGWREGLGPSPGFTRRMAMLLVPVTVIAIGATTPHYRLSSPNLDLAAFVLVAVGMLYLADCVENGFRATTAFTALSSLALAAATRPLFWIPTLLAVGVIALSARASTAARGRGLTQTLCAVSALAALLLVGSMARQAVLSGYLFFPLPIGGLPVDWRMSHAVVSSQNRIDEAWARWPGPSPSVVLASWHWLTAYWLHRYFRSVDLVAPLMLLACLLPAWAGRRESDPARARRWRPMLTVLLPSALTLFVWFWSAPDPRFALAPLWLVPIALVAWALPSISRPRAGELVAAAAVAAALATVGVRDPVWLLPATLAAGAYVYALTLVLRRRVSATAFAYAAVVAVLLAPIGVVADNGSFRPIVADQQGRFGTPLEPIPPLVPLQTSIGLPLTRPANTDQCFEVLLCVPLQVDPDLRLRGSSVSAGFRVSRRPARAATAPTDRAPRQFPSDDRAPDRAPSRPL